jgi:hypothetical protein
MDRQMLPHLPPELLGPQGLIFTKHEFFTKYSVVRPNFVSSDQILCRPTKIETLHFCLGQQNMCWTTKISVVQPNSCLSTKNGFPVNTPFTMYTNLIVCKEPAVDGDGAAELRTSVLEKDLGR